MIPQDLISLVSSLTKIKDTQLLEKDLYLQGIIVELSKSKYFKNNLVFKGGTCLTKVYFGYYRFSEDLDFTWIDQKIFEEKSAKQIRKIISQELNTIIKIIHDLALIHGFDFKPEKSNTNYVEFGGGNKFVTFKLHYTTIQGTKSFIKIQINFLEKLIYPIKEHKINPIGLEFKERLDLEYPEYTKLLTKKSSLFVYDLREIASEKIRAILTRKGFKTRDLIDLYKLSTKKINIVDVKKSAITKTIMMLKYEKYSTSIVKKTINTHLGDEEHLMIIPLEKEYYEFIKKAVKELNLISQEILE
jgi:predicted nucleotidyltransferase component of viral defense system